DGGQRHIRTDGGGDYPVDWHVAVDIAEDLATLLVDPEEAGRAGPTSHLEMAQEAGNKIGALHALAADRVAKAHDLVDEPAGEAFFLHAFTLPPRCTCSSPVARPASAPPRQCRSRRAGLRIRPGSRSRIAARARPRPGRRCSRGKARTAPATGSSRASRPAARTG